MMIAVGGRGWTYLLYGGIPAAKCDEFHSAIWKRVLHGV